MSVKKKLSLVESIEKKLPLVESIEKKLCVRGLTRGLPGTRRICRCSADGLDCLVGRVENSKMFQNQIAQCFFIGLYDIKTGDDFYFFQKKIFDGWKWILKKSIFTREKWLK